MMFIFLFISLAIVGFVALAAQHRTVRIFAAFYYLVQAGFAVAVIPFRIGEVESQFFTFDLLGAIFFVLMTVISAVAFVQSNFYLDRETLRQFKLYNISLMLLCVSATGVYFANNIAVTWIFLEATTLCTAGLVYHRRNTRSLEATWKYIFICSLGIAVAYLGILLLSTVTAGGELSYANLARTVASGNPLYLKIAFLFILVGYSCKMEVFPLYTIGVDANFAAPAPASAVISTVLVNAGFVSFFRVYRVAAASPVYEWFSHVLILAGLISLLIAGVYLRRTNNYKRFLAYSTVECMGLSVVGLGVGGDRDFRGTAAGDRPCTDQVGDVRTNGAGRESLRHLPDEPHRRIYRREPYRSRSPVARWHVSAGFSAFGAVRFRNDDSAPGHRIGAVVVAGSAGAVALLCHVQFLFAHSEIVLQTGGKPAADAFPAYPPGVDLVRPVADRRGFGAGHRAATVPDQIYQCRYRLLDEKVVHDIQPAGECET